MLATASYDKDIKLWDVASGQELRTLSDHIDAVYALAFTPDGSRLVSGSADRSVKVWDPSTGERLFTLGDPIDGINSIAVDPTGGRSRRVAMTERSASGSWSKTAASCSTSLIAHQSTILRIAYSPDGKKIVTASADRTIKVFDAETLDELASLDSQSDWVMSLAFSPDGDRFAAGRFDGSLSIYDSASYRDQLRVNDTSRKSP